MDTEKLVQVSGNLIRPEPTSLDLARDSGTGGGFSPRSAEPTLRDYWRILQKRKWTVISTTLVLVTMVTIASFKMTPRYEAVSRIAVHRENVEMLGFKEVAPSTSEDYDHSIQLATQVRILQSDTLALQVIRQLQLDKNPNFAYTLPEKDTTTSGPVPTTASGLDERQQAALLGRFRSELRVSPVPRSRMIEINYLNPDRHLAAQVVNTLVNAYIEHNFKTKFESTMQTSNWLSIQLLDLQRKVETSQEQLVRYQRENEILGIDEKQNITTARLNELNQQLILAETDRIQKEASYKLTLSANLELVPGVAESRIVQRLKEQEAEVKNQYAQATTQFGPSYPRVVELGNQLKQIESALQTEVRKIAGRIQNEYLTAAEREKMLRAALEKQKDEANLLNERAIQYNVLKRDVESSRELYEGLQQRLKEAGVAAGLRSGNVTVVDIARPPVRPAKPNIPMNIAAGFLLSLGLGIALAFVQESLDTTVRTPGDIQVACGLPSLGFIPIGSHSNSSRKDGQRRRSLALQATSSEPVELIAQARPKSELAEAYRALRTSILLSSLGTPPKIILVTSPLPQEGKTTTSMNLAFVLAQTGSRVLLVDADMRRPSIHKTLHLKLGWGLCGLLATGKIFEELAVPSPQFPNLLILPAGATPPYPAELLGSQLMSDYLAQWRQSFDHVVMDTPPALTVTDAVVLSGRADAVVMVIRAGQTTKQALHRIQDLFCQVGVRITGVVVNAIDLHSSDSYYYGDYYYGSKYGGSYYEDDGKGK